MTCIFEGLFLEIHAVCARFTPELDYPNLNEVTPPQNVFDIRHSDLVLYFCNTASKTNPICFKHVAWISNPRLDVFLQPLPFKQQATFNLLSQKTP